jgi:hypothetical protein
MSALATLAEGSLPRLSQVVARLEQRGWVRRTCDPAAARSIELAESTAVDHRVVRPAARPGWISLPRVRGRRSTGNCVAASCGQV